MTDYSEHGTLPVEDAATDDPPTVDEVLERQRKEYPEQARTGMHNPPLTADERAAVESGGEPVGSTEDGVGVEGPNSE